MNHTVFFCHIGNRSSEIIRILNRLENSDWKLSNTLHAGTLDKNRTPVGRTHVSDLSHQYVFVCAFRPPGPRERMEILRAFVTGTASPNPEITDEEIRSRARGIRIYCPREEIQHYEPERMRTLVSDIDRIHQRRPGLEMLEEMPR